MSSNVSKKRLQFSLKSVLLVVTLVCVCLAAGAISPRAVLSVLSVAAITAPVVFLLIAVDRMLRRDQQPKPAPIGSFILIAVAAWAIVFVLIATSIRIPGGFGPIQYAAGNAWATFVFMLRIGTILVMVGSPILCSIIGGIRLWMGANFRLGWLAIGIALSFVAWILLFFNPQFMPTA
jgi:hypothetical protein